MAHVDQPPKSSFHQARVTYPEHLRGILKDGGGATKSLGTRNAANARAKAVPILAIWHQQGDRLLFPDNIGLLLLPPHSPEPNLQENVWQCFCRNYLANRVFETYDACDYKSGSPNARATGKN